MLIFKCRVLPFPIHWVRSPDNFACPSRPQDALAEAGDLPAVSFFGVAAVFGACEGVMRAPSGCLAGAAARVGASEAGDGAATWESISSRWLDCT